ncbi:hypothetical protein GF402_08555 [Candidatus Fermentibacteria bacterium]|nr:hypothetical protein [Candidatus Fermentibacteria bacterium]
MVVGFLIGFAATATCLDTTEPFDPGDSDWEMYSAMSGLGDNGGAGQREMQFECLIGAGITPAFSASFSYAHSENGYLAPTGDEIGLGLFVTAAEGEDAALDVFGSVATGGSIAFGSELNLYLGHAGAQLIIEESFVNDPAEPQSTASSTLLSPMVHYRPSGGSMELLAALDVAYSEEETETGPVSGGVNVLLSESVELITQLAVEIPGEGEETTFGLACGFVATL